MGNFDSLPVDGPRPDARRVGVPGVSVLLVDVPEALQGLRHLQETLRRPLLGLYLIFFFIIFVFIVVRIVNVHLVGGSLLGRTLLWRTVVVIVSIASSVAGSPVGPGAHVAGRFSVARALSRRFISLLLLFGFRVPIIVSI